jgi:hypothetical protein
MTDRIGYMVRHGASVGPPKGTAAFRGRRRRGRGRSRGPVLPG